jgi:hypothetical protein
MEPVYDRPGLMTRAPDRRSTGSTARAGPVIVGSVLDRPDPADRAPDR